MKKILACCAALALMGMVSFGVATASEKGPAEMTLQSTIDPAKKAKPSIFPHAAHQARVECGVCHHAKDDAGKQVAYVDGQKIEKCESCHNKGETMPTKLATYKGAAHAQCKDCHAKTSKDLAKCGVCHPKQG